MTKVRLPVDNFGEVVQCLEPVEQVRTAEVDQSQGREVKNCGQVKVKFLVPVVNSRSEIRLQLFSPGRVVAVAVRDSVLVLVLMDSNDRRWQTVRLRLISPLRLA